MPEAAPKQLKYTYSRRVSDNRHLFIACTVRVVDRPDTRFEPEKAHGEGADRHTATLSLGSSSRTWPMCSFRRDALCLVRWGVRRLRYFESGGNTSNRDSKKAFETLHEGMHECRRTKQKQDSSTRLKGKSVINERQRSGHPCFATGSFKTCAVTEAE